jgi:hypothetical protein
MNGRAGFHARMLACDYKTTGVDSFQLLPFATLAGM